MNSFDRTRFDLIRKSLNRARIFLDGLEKKLNQIEYEMQIRDFEQLEKEIG